MVAGAPPAQADDRQDLIEAVRVAAIGGDAAAFRSAVAALLEARDATFLGPIGEMRNRLNDAIATFGGDPRLMHLAERDVPDARRRLEHVLGLTNEAAHRTLQLVEQCGPLLTGISERLQQVRAVPAGDHGQAGDAGSPPAGTSVDGSLRSMQDDLEAVRQKLRDVLLAQSYQDLSGQIIGSVIRLTKELEEAMTELLKLPYGDTQASAPVRDASAGLGPPVPGIDNGPIVQGQNDVDSLLANLGL